MTRPFRRSPALRGRPIRPAYQYDLGKSFDYADMTGAITVTPPRIIKATPQLMPRIDADGNELDGIRSPLITAPLGTYVGWNVTAVRFRERPLLRQYRRLYSLCRHQSAERLAKGDPRPSLEERYPSHAAYVAKVKAQADALVAERYMLPADAARIVAEAEAAKVP